MSIAGKKTTAEAYKAALNRKKAKAEANALAGKLPIRRTGGAARASLSPGDRLVLEPERAALTGYCRGHWWRLEQDGLVPRRIRIGPRKVAWLLSELQNWMLERAAERNSVVADNAPDCGPVAAPKSPRNLAGRRHRIGPVESNAQTTAIEPA